MMDREFHFVKRGKTIRMPRRHIFLDTEAPRKRVGKEWVQRWLLGVAAFRTADKGRKPKDSLVEYDTPAQLWADVDAFCRPRSRVILWAHNLAYDVRISRAFETLPAMGWRCTTHNLASRGTWIHWTKNDKTLCMVDSQSVFAVPLETLGTHFMLPKVPLPSGEDSRAVWAARCVRDVEILRDAIVAYLYWLEKEQLGSWQLTGAGQSYAAFRHKFLTHSMLVHNDPDALSAERRAMWTGRCEAYYRGRVGRDGMEEWDLSLAYARIALRSRVPVRLIGPAPANSDVGGLLSRKGYSVLADVEIETDSPTVPASLDGRMVWPVGVFDTTLWGPELDLARANGATIHVKRAWLYSAQPALATWADYIITHLECPDACHAAWQKIVLKHWARALIGRFGMRYTEWQKYGVTDQLRVMHAMVYDVATQEQYDITHVGRDVSRSSGEVEWDQSQPAITGFIMSACRVWLWRLCEAVGAGRVLYADTDSLYVRPEEHERMVALSQTTLGQGLRLKATHRRATILGPRQIVTDGRPRIAGLPKSAVSMPDGSYHGEVWMSLAQAMRRGQPTAVITTDRVWKVSGVDNRRALGPGGWTHPIHVRDGVRVDEK